ncbi:hypothetical protein GGR51DRAFT_554665 [Nemania sp. FL0031]|nr:hypothetical protein GGR51DRAFT_554665 [Nemania sp. FL0031]
MPDHYTTLGIQQTATNAEITAAYRRMAFLHHPDRNLENTGDATRRFQRIQEAYDVLSDDTHRRRYDEARNRYQGLSFPEVYVYWVVRERHRYYAEIARAQREEAAAQRERELEEMLKAQEEERRAAKQAEQEKRRAEEQAEQEKRRAEEQAREEERLAAEEAKKAEIEKARQSALKQEADKQQVRWEGAGVTTEEAKRSTCLHSSLCAKTQHRKKVKCEACGVKRGMIAFKCPHCSSNICQLCLSNSAKKRAQDEDLNSSNHE